MSARDLLRWLRRTLKRVDPVAVIEILAALSKLKVAKTPAERHRAIVDLAKAVAKLFR